MLPIVQLFFKEMKSESHFVRKMKRFLVGADIFLVLFNRKVKISLEKKMMKKMKMMKSLMMRKMMNMRMMMMKLRTSAGKR